MKELKVKVVREGGKIDYPAKPGDAGYDVYTTKTVIINPSERCPMPLGIALEFDDGYYCQIAHKSGIAKNQGVFTIGGIVDSGYRGELVAILVNSTMNQVVIAKGTKIAQLIFMPFVKPEIEYVEELTESERGSDGFGSTGK